MPSLPRTLLACRGSDTDFFSSEIRRQNEEIILALAVLGTLQPDQRTVQEAVLLTPSQGRGEAATRTMSSR